MVVSTRGRCRVAVSTGDFSERGRFIAVSRSDFDVLCGPVSGSPCEIAELYIPHTRNLGYEDSRSMIFTALHLGILIVVCFLRLILISTTPSAEQRLPGADERVRRRSSIVSSGSPPDQGDEQVATVESQPLVRRELPEATAYVAVTASRVDSTQNENV